MNRHLLVAAGLSVLAVVEAGAQGGTLQCAGGTTAIDPKTIAQDACQQAHDIYQFVAPQLAVMLAGGNATIGQGSTLGGFGHFSIGVRVNAVQGDYPDVGNYSPGTSGAQARALATKSQLLPLPTADAAIGILGGIPLGVTNILAVDALVSASYVPSGTTAGISVTPSQNLQLGYGARVGILQESIVVPGVAVTYLKRDLPTTLLSAKAASSTFTITDLSVKTTAWRIVASKTLLLFGVVVGYGQDSYEQSAQISGSSTTALGTSTSTIPNTTQSRTRSNMFADLSLNLPLFKIVGEVGQVSGGDAIPTYNTFSAGKAGRDLRYFSAGIRFGL